MVGIVIVSHSRKIAEGLEELARSMTPGITVPIAFSGGTGDPHSPLGTDASAVYGAIQAVDSPDGVCIFSDLGSARLAAETAVELFPAEARGRLVCCNAPLVEGVLAAAARAAGGADLPTVLAEAERAKADTSPRQSDTGETDGDEQAGGITLELVLSNPHGLHARPAARMVSLLGRFGCAARLKNSTRANAWADAKSMSGVLTRDARKGDRVLFRFQGEDAQAARSALLELAAEGFGDGSPAEVVARRESEAPSDRTGPAPTALPAAGNRSAGGSLSGLPISRGFAVGRALRHRPSIPKIAYRTTTSPAGEVARITSAVERSRGEIRKLMEGSKQDRNAYDASIFDAHLMFLDDPALTGRAVELISKESVTAETAWYKVVVGLLEEYDKIEDETLRARADDLRDVASRVLSHLSVEGVESLPSEVSDILVMTRLNPSDVSVVEESAFLAVCAATGSRNSHSAILSRSLGIPVIFSLGEEITQIEDGTLLAVDGEQGLVHINPSSDTVAEIEKKRAAWLEHRSRSTTRAGLPPESSDGRRIHLLANIRGASDLTQALAAGAEGVGLFRTEFLYIGRSDPPSEEVQFDAYREATGMLAGRPLIVRTIDLGGDKPLPALRRPEEPNPFLGERGIRLALSLPDLFLAQLRALRRASAFGDLKIMLPMVGLPSEVEATRRLIARADDEIEASGFPRPPAVELGIMVELPSAVSMLAELLPVVDFVSIGTNDLAQYIMAADRSNPRVESLADPLQPPVLRAIRATVDACSAASVPCGMCGEMAGDQELLPLLLGLGFTSLSMSPALIPDVGRRLRELSYAQCREFAARALAAETIEAVRAVLAE